MLIPFFQQFDGINAIIFYSSQLFDILGSGQQSALLSSVIVGAGEDIYCENVSAPAVLSDATIGIEPVARAEAVSCCAIRAPLFKCHASGQCMHEVLSAHLLVHLPACWHAAIGVP